MGGKALRGVLSLTRSSDETPMERGGMNSDAKSPINEKLNHKIGGKKGNPTTIDLVRKGIHGREEEDLEGKVKRTESERAKSEQEKDTRCSVESFFYNRS